MSDVAYRIVMEANNPIKEPQILYGEYETYVQADEARIALLDETPTVFLYVIAQGDTKPTAEEDSLAWARGKFHEIQYRSQQQKARQAKPKTKQRSKH